MIARSTVSPALKIGLRLLGVWPGVSHSTVYWLIFMSSILVIQYFQYLYILEHFKITELSNLVDGLSLTLDYSLTFLKLASLWIHRRVFHKILALMDNDWRECINIDQHLSMMTINASVSHFYSNAMLSFNGVAAVLYVLGDYVIRFVYSTKDYNNTLRQLPIKMLLPFETEQSPIFELLVVTLFLHVILISFTVAVLNGLIFTLVLHVSGQIDIICQEFRNISVNAFPYRSSAFILGMLIEKHNKVYAFSENIETLFSFIALMQVIWNTLVICCLGFIIIISVHNETDVFVFVKATLAYFAVIIEAFIICFAGEYLSLKSKSIADAAYESLWYNMPPNQCKIISFMIMRSQRRLSITAGKMMDMSFEALTNIMKTSVSYVSVLHAMY
ncbi:odorant receptor 22c-like isoform X1 [Temnothorax longispinosus]|uniref:odorant receptor 22c-like isoform X1 n=1 Tax=Temnothorax longispinosus TaxID=300112 RepID=UPI003A999FA0